MKKKTGIYCPFLLLFLSGCFESSYLYSPNNATSNPYHAIPLKSDSLKGATYISAIFNSGRANQDLRDGVYAFQARVHRSNNFGNFQAYYGANMSVGIYYMADYYDHHNFYDTAYHASNNFFGSYGFNGGFDAVVPTRHGGEWRVLGIETSVQKEFGNYYKFRKNLPDSAADVIFKKNVTGTVGIFTNIINRSRHGIEFGYKMSLGLMLNPESDYTHFYNPYNIINPIVYFSHVLHFSKENVTGFVQFNFTNGYAANVQFGMNYRPGKTKKN